MGGEDSEPRRRSASEELARDPESRRSFFKLAGAAGAASLALAGCGDDEESKAELPTQGDLEIVNFLLTVEYVEQDLYRAIIEARILRGSDLTLVRRLEQNEGEHVRALEAAARNLDGRPQARPGTDFSAVLGSRRRALSAAATIEGAGAGGYLGELFAIDSKETLATVLSIHSVEARHAAATNRRVGRSFSPQGAFGQPLSKREVMRRLDPFIT